MDLSAAEGVRFEQAFVHQLVRLLRGASILTWALIHMPTA